MASAQLRGSQFYSEWSKFGAPGTIRTSAPQIRSLMLLLEARAHDLSNFVARPVQLGGPTGSSKRAIILLEKDWHCAAKRALL
jgi:hypothetical protein